MNKHDVINQVSTATSQSKSSTLQTVETILDAGTQAVSRGYAVQLIGFGTFSSGARAERTGRNPATGAQMKIPAAKTVRFSAGKACKETVNS